MAKGLISKSGILWLMLTLVILMFAMASAGSEGINKYVYFIVAFICCYGIRLIAKKEVKNDRD